MSVYTIVKKYQLEDFLSNYNVGHLIAYQGINAGIENTNYFVTTEKAEFVLTLFEQHSFDELYYFLDLMAYIAKHGVPSAMPAADKNGRFLRELNAKPAALVQCLSGKDVVQPTLVQCTNIGRALGHFHVISTDFPEHRSNGRGTHWWKVTAERVLPKMKADEADLLRAELKFQADYQSVVLPKGVIHADLFRDNALFDGDNLSGIIDFYYACNDVLLYDVAVTVNDWCSLPDGSLEQKRLDALLLGYAELRTLNSLENEIWPVMLRAAALRFWLSRLQDFHFPRPGELTHIKNPDAFLHILQGHIK